MAESDIKNLGENLVEDSKGYLIIKELYERGEEFYKNFCIDRITSAPEEGGYLIETQMDKLEVYPEEIYALGDKMNPHESLTSLINSNDNVIIYSNKKNNVITHPEKQMIVKNRKEFARIFLEGIKDDEEDPERLAKFGIIVPEKDTDWKEVFKKHKEMPHEDEHPKVEHVHGEREIAG